MGDSHKAKGFMGLNNFWDFGWEIVIKDSWEYMVNGVQLMGLINFWDFGWEIFIKDSWEYMVNGFQL